MRSHGRDRTPLFVRLPKDQATALDRLADATGRAKQHLVSEVLADRLLPKAGLVSVGRVEVSTKPTVDHDDVLTLEEVATLLKVPTDAVKRCVERGDLPGRRFGDDWRFARTAVLTWLGNGEPQNRRHSR
jgi:excisionase family DNA binding protein